MEKENNTTALHLERNQPDPTLLENEPLSAHARHFCTGQRILDTKSQKLDVKKINK